MSIDIMNRLWWRDFDHDVAPIVEEHPGSGRNLKWTLIAMADNASDDGFCWPAVETIMRKASLGRRAVQQALRQAEVLLILRRRHRTDASTQYVFNLDKLPHVERPKRSKERGPIDYFEEEPDLFPRGAGDAPLPGGPVHGVRPTRASHARTGAPHAPRTVIEPSDEPSGGDAHENIILDDDQIVDLFISIWNANASQLERVPTVMRVGGAQRKALLLRVKEHAEDLSLKSVTALLEKVMEVIAGSLWLRGESDRGTWVVTTLWATGKQNFEKIVGGFYVQDAAAGAARPKRRDERSYADTAERVGAILRARGPTPRQTARELAGLPARGSSGDHR